MSVRGAFLDSATATRHLLAHPAVATRWDAPSSLPEMSVAALAGHLGRSVIATDAYLEAPAPDGLDGLVDAAGYLVSFPEISGPEGPDLNSDFHRAIRSRAAEEAGGGPEVLVARWDAAASRLAGRLALEPPTRTVEVIGGRALLLDEYLVTRLVEMLVHADDLATSVAAPLPDYPERAWEAVIGCLVEVARRRHRDVAVVRAMTRVERDTVRALRVL
jgi:hypothetical protein